MRSTVPVANLRSLPKPSHETENPESSGGAIQVLPAELLVQIEQDVASGNFDRTIRSVIEYRKRAFLQAQIESPKYAGDLLEKLVEVETATSTTENMLSDPLLKRLPSLDFFKYVILISPLNIPYGQAFWRPFVRPRACAVEK